MMTKIGFEFINISIGEFALADLSHHLSARFKTKNGEFLLRIYAKDVLKDMANHVVIYLLRDDRTHASGDQRVMWTVGLVNDQKKECYRKEIETNFSAQSNKDCYPNYPVQGGVYQINRDIILNPSNGLLPGGRLYINFTITILDSENWANDNKKIITLTKSNALENYQSLLENSKFSDVVFVVGKKEFKLHKAILATQSPVFAAMFDSDLEEAKQNRVEIIDVDVEVFEAMIRFIYTGNVDSVQQNALDLFVAADKYLLDSLKDICADYLCTNLTIESVFKILSVADMHSAQKVKLKCIEFINENTAKVFDTERWKQLIKSRHQLGLELYYDLANKFNKK